MTNEEALNELSVLWERMKRAEESGVLAYKTIMYYDGQYVEALDLAIKSLERPQCEWIDNSKEDSYYANCSHCNYQIDTHYERGYLNYCPNCGAKMQEVEE